MLENGIFLLIPCLTMIEMFVITQLKGFIWTLRKEQIFLHLWRFLFMPQLWFAVWFPWIGIHQNGTYNPPPLMLAKQEDMDIAWCQASNSEVLRDLYSHLLSSLEQWRFFFCLFLPSIYVMGWSATLIVSVRLPTTWNSDPWFHCWERYSFIRNQVYCSIA